jgi:ATP-binding protein involved in chromosome partitioning
MNNLSSNNITKCLAAYIFPELGQDLVSASAIKSISIENDVVSLHIALGFPFASQQTLYVQLIQEYLQQQLNVTAEIKFNCQIKAYQVKTGVPLLKNVKNIIAVASGKGGVGKSTTTVNLALALQAEGAKVGILDADIYGPSIPTMLGISHKPESLDGKTIEPLQSYGLQFMSIGCLIDAEQPIIWRGAMISKTLQQIIRDTNWRDLDYLLIDLPPGTGDTQLTMAQKIPVTGGIIVTTPQDIALQDAKRGLQMLNKVNIPVLGIVENMSTHICTQCGHTDAIFGASSGEQFASQYQVPLLGKLPLVSSICENADNGKPTVVAEKNSELTREYCAIARQAAARLSLLGRDYSSKFGNIKVEHKD